MTKKPLLLLSLLGSLSLAHAEIVILDGPVATPGKPKEAPSKPAIGVPQPKEREPNKEAAKPKKKLDTIRFLNRDQLQGTLNSIGAEGIIWQSPEALGPITFAKTNVDEIRLDGGSPPKDQADQFSVVLNSSDELFGKITELTTSDLTLDTWYGGRLKIPRELVAKLVPLQSTGDAIFEGPTGVEGWKISNRNDQPGWKFRGDAFISSTSATLGREIVYPKMFTFDFTMSWKGYLQMIVTLFSESTENSSSGGYMLQMNNNYVYLQKMVRNRGSNNLGQQEIPNLMSRSKADVSLKVNQEAKTVTLFINGEMIRQWTDAGDFQGNGKAFVFYSQGQSQMKISKIRVAEWDGKLEQATGGPEKSDQDTVRLANNDKVSGTVKSIAGGVLKLTSPYADLEIPLNRIRQLDLKHAKATEAKPGPSDVRLIFSDGGKLVLTLDKFEAGSFQGSSPAFGKAAFKKEAFSKIMFSPALEREGDEEDDDSLQGGEEMEGVMLEGRLLRENIIGQPIFNR